MKTLKKTLCLVLAMVMVFGLCAVSASAKLEFSDNDAITYEEAVDVLAGIGILKGDTRGFRPTDPITRAEAAKIIAYIKIGNAAQADALKASADPFTDVPATHWAAGYIAYCASAKIIGGMGDGTYHPSEPVSGLAFAKMLLCALGYGAKDEYIGTDWSINIATDAIRLGVFKDNLAGANPDPATREQCALYAFNVIARNYGTVAKPSCGLSKVSYSDLLGRYDDGTAFGAANTDANKKGTFASDFNLSIAEAENNAFGHPTGYHYTQKVGNTTKTITADYDDTSKLQKVYTAKVTGDDIYKLLGKDVIKAANGEDGEITVTIDGVKETAFTNAKDTEKWNDKGLARGNTDTLFGTGNGVETYVYAYKEGDTQKIEVVIVNTYLAKISTVTEATAKKDRSVEIKDLYNDGGVTASAKAYETEDFDEGDYVLVTIAKNDKGENVIKSMVPAIVVEDEITRFNQDGKNKSIVVNGKTYTPAEKAVNPGDGRPGDEIARDLVNGKTHKVYVDENGYVIGVATASSDDTYVFAAHFGKMGASSNGFDSEKPAVLLYYADGTSKTVELSKIDGETVKASDFDGDKGDEKIGLYMLKMTRSKAELTQPSEDEDDDSAPVYADMSEASVNVSKNITSAGTAGAFDGKTVFFYVKGTYKADNLSVTVYTGISNVPRDKDGDNAPLQAAISASNKVKAACVKDNGSSDDGDIVYYFQGTEDDTYYSVEDGGKTVVYKVYEPGKKDLTEITITYDDSDKADEAIGDAKEAGFYYQKGKKLAEVTEKKGEVYYVAETKLAAASSVSVSFKTSDSAESATEFDTADHASFVNLTDETISGFNKLSDLLDDYTITVAVSYKDGQVNDLYVIDCEPKPAE